MRHVMGRLTPKVMADLRHWALAVIAEPATPTDLAQPVESVPQFVRDLDRQHGRPGVLVYRERSGLGPSVILMWRYPDEGVLVLIIGSADYQLDPFLVSLWQARRAEQGIYCYFMDFGRVQ
jgi:hypothetical protein